MSHTVRFQKILERAEQIAKDEGLPYVDSYCVTKAMLDGSIYNMCYIAFIKCGINIDHFLAELEAINQMRGPYSQLSSNPAPGIVEPHSPGNK